MSEQGGEVVAFTLADDVTIRAIELGLAPQPWQIALIAAIYAPAPTSPGASA